MILPVFILFGVLVLLFLNEKGYSKPSPLLLVGVFTSMLLIITFRNTNMSDAQGYIQYFQGYSTGERFEALWQMLNQFLRKICDNYLYLFAATGALALFIKFKLIKSISPFFYGSLLVYLSNFFILHDMIQIRAGVAASLLLFAVKYISERNLIKFIIVTILAIGFHNSAYMIIPLWFVPYIKISRNSWLCVIPVCYVLALSGLRIGNLISRVPIDTIQQMFTTYTNLAKHGIYNDINILNMKILAEVSIAMYLIFNIEKIRPHFSQIETWLKVYTIGFIIYILCSDLPIVSGRLGDFIRVVEIITIPLVAYTFKPMFLSKLLVCVVALSLLVIIVFYNGYLL